jgi:predicted ATPase
LRRDISQGSDASFELGQRDFPARFTPGGLVGREAELALLQVAFAEALAGTSRTVVIHGPAGVGKSALIHEFRSCVLAANGWVVRGKVDQYLKEQVGAGALTQALRCLGRLLLAQSAEVLASERERIVAAVGPGVAQITALPPEFALILGPQPELAPIDPAQAELRQLQAIVGLIAAIASPSRPLVIVLDDLQWAAAQSLRSFQRLMDEPGISGMLLAGVYRGAGPGPDNAAPSRRRPTLHRMRRRCASRLPISATGTARSCLPD